MIFRRNNTPAPALSTKEQAEATGLAVLSSLSGISYAVQELERAELAAERLELVAEREEAEAQEARLAARAAREHAQAVGAKLAYLISSESDA